MGKANQARIGGGEDLRRIKQKSLHVVNLSLVTIVINYVAYVIHI